MKVKKIIEKLEKLDPNLDVWVSADGKNYSRVQLVDIDDEDDVILLGEIEEFS